MDPKLLAKEITSSLATTIEEMVKTQVYQQTVHKDSEVSGLHQEILTKIDSVKQTVDSHDKIIQEWNEIWKTAGIVKKWVMALLIFVPTFAAFIAGVVYIKNLFHINN